MRVKLGMNKCRTHSLYKELLNTPPEGVEYTTNYFESELTLDNQESPLPAEMLESMSRSPLVRSVVDPVFTSLLLGSQGTPSKREVLLARGFSNITRVVTRHFDLDTHFDVYHSADSAAIESIPWIVENRVQWVVDCEHVGSLFGYYGNWRKRICRNYSRNIIEKQLAAEYCRKIMPWTQSAKATIENIISSRKVNRKIEVVRLAIRRAPPRSNKISRSDRIRILFLGSSNFEGEFWSKGGYEVLESYRRLLDSQGEAVELIFRCSMPEEMHKRYSRLPGLRVVNELLPRQQLDDLMYGSDVFFFPAHHTPGMAFLEAMRFGLPIVGKNIWANSELVREGVTGFLVDPSDHIPYLLPGMVPNWSTDSGPFLRYMKMHDEQVISKLVDRLERLVESKNLRQRMGQAGKSLVEVGDMSIARRNAQLKRIYEEAARR